jgi:hypothetical protein
MKTRFLCLLGLVTVILSYAPLVQSAEALRFDRADLSSAATESNLWSTQGAAPAAPVFTPSTQAAAPGMPALPEAIESDPIPVTIVPKAAEEPTVKPITKPDVFEKPAPAPAESTPLSFEAAPSKPIPSAAPPPAQPVPQTESAPQPAVSEPAPPKPVELVFTLPPAKPLYEPSREMPHVPAAPLVDEDPGAMTDRIFTGNSNSLVAKAVGSAEGTRTPEGDRTRAYYGHVDPGNRVWNRGSFSYQHSAKSPEDADMKQLNRLANQAKILEAKAAERGLQLTLEEKLNGIDLANQAPKAALDREGYIDWLAQSRQRGMKGSEAILWARTRSFINPVTQRWDAPGLGNTGDRIQRDQARRMEAIGRAITVNQHTVNRAMIADQLPTPKPNAKSAPAVHAEGQSAEGQGIAHLLAEKIVDLFGGDQVPAASKPLTEEVSGIQQLFGFGS